MIKIFKDTKQIVNLISVQLDMVRARLLKFQFSFHSQKCVYLSCVEIFQFIFKDYFKYFEFTHKLKSFTNSKIKGMNEKPKSKGSRNKINSGLAKANKSYAVRGLGVAVFQYEVLNSIKSTINTSL